MDLDVVGIGSMVMDRIHRVPRLLGAEEKLALTDGPSGPVLEVVGGVTLNHLAWAAALGLRTGLFGRQADDAPGRFIRAAAQGLGLSLDIRLDGASSSFSLVFVAPGGHRCIYMSPGTTALTFPEHLAYHMEFIDRAKALSTEISQLPLATVIAALEAARARDIPSFLDVDIPPSQAVGALGTAAELDRALRLADVLKPSGAAARELAGNHPSGELVRRIFHMYNEGNKRIVAMTDGAEGSALTDGTEVVAAPAYAAASVDTTGAGDAWFGGLLAGMHHDLPLQDLARLANACGAACVETFGAVPDAHSLGRVLARYDGRPLPRSPRPTEPPSEPWRAAVAHLLAAAPRELAATAARLPLDAVGQAMRLVLAREDQGGRVHVTGVGKPEHLARLAAATLSSTGTPATFLHATECVHGSLGQVRPGDVVLAISNSGETPELLVAVQALKERGARIVAVCGRPGSPLALQAELTLDAGVSEEGGLLGLVPRASVLAEAMVLQALSVALEAERSFSRADYGALHPAGKIGRLAREP